MAAPLKTFIIYASADREYRTALERQLKSLIDNDLIQLWSDKEILPGEVWDAAIKKRLLESELFLMLVSADFFNSNYIREKEFSLALEKLERGEAIVVPIIVRDCDWEAYEVIQKLQVLPPGGVAVTDLRYWHQADIAWATITREIRSLITTQRTAEQQQAEKNVEIERQKKEAAEKNQIEDLIKKDRLEEALQYWIQQGVDNTLRTDLIQQMSRLTKASTDRNRGLIGFKEESHVRNKVSFALLSLLNKWNLGDNSSQLDQALTETERQKRKADEKEKTLTEDARLTKTEKQPDDFVEMVFIEGGHFEMGDVFEEGESCEKPVHVVQIADFFLSKNLVTQAQWETIMGYNHSHFKNTQLPIDCINWQEAQEFIRLLNKRSGMNYRLPSEAEWEFAARERGNKIRFGNGKNFALATEINFDSTKGNTPSYVIKGDNWGKTTPISSFPANSLGLYDMSGNLWEWCADVWHENYYNAPSDGSVWMSGGEQNKRVIRGGSWVDEGAYCRTTYRFLKDFDGLNKHNFNVGFRLARHT